MIKKCSSISAAPLRWLFISIAGAGLFAFPLKTEKFMVKFFNKGLTIQTARRDPPRIAFNELLAVGQAARSEEYKSVPEIDLNIKIDEKTGGKFSQQPTLWVKARRISLKPMVFSRDQALAENQKVLNTKDWLEDLSVEQKRRVLAANDKSQILESDWSLPSWKDLLEEQIVKAKKETETSRDSKVYITATGDEGVVGTPDDIHTSDVKIAESVPAYQTVQGKIRLEKGLYLGDGYIDLRHVQGRIPQGVGRVDLAKGNYSINVPDYTGTVVATLYTKGGERLGEGSLRLSQISPTRFGSSEIVMSPILNTVAVHHVDFAGEVAGQGTKNHYGDRGLPAHSFYPSLDSEQKADSSGSTQVQNVVKGSWTIVRSELDKYQNSLFLVQAGAEVKAPLFKKTFASALINIAKDFQNSSLVPETKSIVWGQVKMDGKPASGVAVEAEYQEGYQILYFNSLMLPDVNLTATGENGYFAILHLPEGMHSLIGTRGKQYFSHINVVTEPDVFSQIEMNGTSHLEPTELKVFDAFDGGPREATVEIQSLSEAVSVRGVTQIYLPQIDRLSFMKINPVLPGYLPAMMVYKDTQDSLLVPLIRQDWIQSLRASRKIDDDPNSSIVVGFVQDEPYEVYLPHVSDFPRKNIVYFNSQGQVVEEGEPGGGFVLFNVMAGTQAVVTVSKTTNLIHSQIIPVDPGVIDVLQFHF